MSATITKTWSGLTRTRGIPGADTAMEIFNVLGTSKIYTEDQALDDLASTTGRQVGYPFVGSNGVVMYAQSLTARLITPGMYEVQVPYSISSGGTPNPSMAPWKYTWKTVVESVPFDRDIAGNPITNSARCPFHNPPSKTITYKSLQIVRNEPWYDYGTYKLYENCVNSDSVVLLQPNGNNSVFGPGEIKCCSIEPVGSLTTKDQYVPISINLEIYDTSIVKQTDPFQLHILDQGSMGFWDDNGTKRKGNIWTTDHQVSTDQPLNGYGLPLDSTLKIESHTPVAFSGSLPDGATKDLDTTPPSVFLQYKRYKAIPLLPLLTGVYS